MGLLTFNIEWFHHIMVDELKVLMANPMLYIALAAGKEVINHSHLMTVHHQLISQVWAHKACTTSDLQPEKIYWMTNSKQMLIPYGILALEAKYVQMSSIHPSI